MHQLVLDCYLLGLWLKPCANGVQGMLSSNFGPNLEELFSLRLLTSKKIVKFKTMSSDIDYSRVRSKKKVWLFVHFFAMAE